MKVKTFPPYPDQKKFKPGPHTDPLKTNAIRSAIVNKYRHPTVVLHLKPMTDAVTVAKTDLVKKMQNIFLRPLLPSWIRINNTGTISAVQKETSTGNRR